MANLSQEKRQRMLALLQKIKEEHTDDDDMLVALGEIENELNAKKYGLVWEKHEEEVDRMMQDNIPVFTEVKEREIKATDENSYNFLLEGDNLHSLKLLEKTHAGKIDVIYIDPPYNTGNKDFIYDDAFVDKNDGYAHSKWLSFMSERLEIAKRLLSDDGVIFINIDENEAHQLKLLLDEVFSIENFVGEFIWKARSGKSGTNSLIAVSHEYIYCYAKSISSVNFFSELKTTVNDKKEALRQWGQNVYREDRPTMFFPIFYKNKIFELPQKDELSKIYHNGLFDDEYLMNLVSHYKNDNFICILPKINNTYGRWRQSYQGVQKLIDNNLLSIELDNNSEYVVKKIIPAGKVTKMAIDSILEDVGTASNGTIEIKKLFDGEKVFSTTKPLNLVCKMLKNGVYNKHNATVLDFFAGSGTTAHAVLELNKEDGGNRKFILCTNNENNICEEVTYERIKRVIHGYADVEGIPANLKYFKTDFIPKDADDVSEELLSHIKEMVELENGITLDNKHYLIVLSDEQADELAKNWSNYKDVKAIYVSRNVLFTSEQDALFSNTEIHIIPDYYFEYELKEVGETW
ncbi:site-specific DNA-methyltransferase [Veillonellaceae bacterium M2-4]|nr:site-specific DNA-methyltransferase [Veillonellaceae bacterium M2-4]